MSGPAWPANRGADTLQMMAGALFDAQRAAVMAGMAREAGCDPAVFRTERLTILPRPEPPAWSFTAMLCTFGTGTTLTVERDFLQWARHNQPAVHYRAFGSPFLDAMVAEARQRGALLSAFTGSLGFALRSVPPLEPVPGYRFEYAGPEWMTAERSRGIFHNALGRRSEDYRSAQYRFAILARRDGPRSELAAVAGVFDTTGLYEIGVDVARSHRGKGLSEAVVARAITAVLDIGGTPFYSCSVTNIRSQRTALSSGFLPVCSMGYVAPEDADAAQPTTADATAPT